jgi:type II restriction enzyme
MPRLNHPRQFVSTYSDKPPKRQAELQAALKNCRAKPIFVSAFPDFATFKKFLTKIAWETEVWIADMPSHLIHFNGDRFLGPH